jgi:integrase
MRKDGRAAASAIYEGKRITKYGKTKTEAKQKLDTYLADLRSGKLVVGPKQTVGQYLTHWLEDQHRLQIEITTLSSYRSVLSVHLIPAFGHLQLSQLTREHIQVFCSKKLDDGISPGWIHYIHAVLSSALTSAVEHDLLTKNPCSGVVLPRIGRKKPNVLTQEECRRLIEAAKGRRLWFLLLVAITTGARLGEMLALRWSDFDLNNLRIHIHRSVSYVNGVGYVVHDTKSESGARRVVLSQLVTDGINEQRAYIDQLRKRAGSSWVELGLVFPNKYGRYLSDDVLYDELRAVFADAGLDQRTFHKFRHSAATLLFAAGVNPKVVQEALGHSSISITLGMYGDVTPDMQQEVGRVMDRLFGE